MKRPLKIVLAGLATLFVLLGLAVVLIDVDALVEAKKPELLKRASEAVGRDVTVGKIDARILPSFGATVTDVRVAGRTAEAPALLDVGDVELRLSLWKALTSLGKDLEVNAIELRRVKAHVARAENGEWSFSDILDRQEEAPKDDEPTDLSFLEGASIERAALLDADITVDDAQLGRPLKAEGTSLILTDVRLGTPLTADLKTTLVDGAKRTAVSLTAKLAELPKTLSFEPFPELTAALQMGELDVGPWGALLPRDSIAPAGGTVSADVTVDAGKDLTTFQGKGTVKASALVLQEAGKRGKPLDADVGFDLDLDTKAPRYVVRSLSVKGTGMEVSGSLDADKASLAGVKTADVSARVQDLQRVLAVLPPGTAALPEELTLAGPVVATLKGNAQAVDLTVNLDDAKVGWADSFKKAPGRALNLTMTGKKVGDVLAIEPFALQVDTAKLGGKLGLPMDDDAPLTADIQSGDVTLASLREIVPPFAEALQRGDRVDGTFSVKATAKSEGGKQDARVLLALSGLDVNLKNASARGAGKVEAVITPKDGVLDIHALADLTALALSSVKESGEKVLDKPAGMPARLEVAVAKTDVRADVRQALLAVGATQVTAKGEATALNTDSPRLDLDFGSIDIAFDDLRKTLPGAESLPPGGRLRGQVRVTGSPDALSTLEVVAQQLDLAFGTTTAKGDLKVVNLDEPRVEADFPALKVAFDDVRALTGTDSLPAGGRYEGAVKVGLDTARTSTMTAALKVDRLRVGRSELRGTASLESLERPTFRFDFTGDDVDIDELLVLFGADGEETAAKEEKPRDNPHGLSDSARATLKKTNGQGTIKAGSVVFRELPTKDFVGQLTMTNGVVTFDALDFKLYGGTVSAKGTTLDLPAEFTGYGLKLNVERMDLGQALDQHTDLGGIFRGEVSEVVDLSGRGLTKRDLITTLSGPTVLRTDSLTIASLDVLTPILQVLEQASKTMPGTPKILGKASSGTDLKDVEAWLRFLGGKMELEKPITTKTAFGAITFTGQAFLDTRLDLEAIVQLSPATIAQWTGNKVKPSSAIDVPLKIGGTWKEPAITGIDAGKLVQAVLGIALTGALGDVAADVQKQAEKMVDDVTKQGVDRAKQEVDKQRRQAEDAAKRAKDQATGAAKKQTDAAKKKAADAKKKAEAEAKKKADAAKKKAEAEAKKKKDAAKKKAEEEAKKLLGF